MSIERTKTPPLKPMPSDQDISSLAHYSRHTSEGNHPFYGNFIGDVLDALVGVHNVTDGDAQEEYDAAETLVEAAQALRDYADRKLTGELI